MPRQRASIRVTGSELRLQRFQGAIAVGGLSTAAFSPASISGLVAWYDASDPTTLFTDTGLSTHVASDGDLIKGWSDKSGGGFSLSEATNPPSYKTTIQGGNSVARFNGTSTHIDNTGGTWANISQPLTIAFSAVTTSAAAKMLFDSTVSRVAFFVNSGPVWDCYAGSSRAFTGAPAADTAWHSFVFVVNGASSTLSIDGTTYTVVADPGANAMGKPRLGTDSTAALFWAGDLGEMAFYNSALSSADIDRLQNYLKSRWATP